MGTTLSISSLVFILLKLIEGRLQTAVSPSIFSFSTINIRFPCKESKAVILLALNDPRIREREIEA